MQTIITKVKARSHTLCDAKGVVGFHQMVDNDNTLLIVLPSVPYGEVSLIHYRDTNRFVLVDNNVLQTYHGIRFIKVDNMSIELKEGTL